MFLNKSFSLIYRIFYLVYTIVIFICIPNPYSKGWRGKCFCRIGKVPDFITVAIGVKKDRAFDSFGIRALRSKIINDISVYQVIGI